MKYRITENMKLIGKLCNIESKIFKKINCKFIPFLDLNFEKDLDLKYYTYTGFFWIINIFETRNPDFIDDGTKFYTISPIIKIKSEYYNELKYSYYCTQGVVCLFENDSNLRACFPEYILVSDDSLNLGIRYIRRDIFKNLSFADDFIKTYANNNLKLYSSIYSQCIDNHLIEEVDT